jgi:hypothetical protein
MYVHLWQKSIVMKFMHHLIDVVMKGASVEFTVMRVELAQVMDFFPKCRTCVVSMTQLRFEPSSAVLHRTIMRARVVDHISVTW